MAYDGVNVWPASAFVGTDGEVGGVDTENGAVHITLGDTPSADAFNRLRVSQPITVFENKNIHSRHPTQWEEETNGVGASIDWVKLESSVDLTIGTVSGEYAIRQAERYSSYFPARSQVANITGVFGAGKANVRQRIGLFDARDGLFFQLDGTTLSVVVRSFVTGSADDTVVEQAVWNIDKLDGTGKSGIVLDPTKTQIFNIDYQWLGVGRVRFGFNLNGRLILCHEIDNSNTIDVPYMSTPTLPVRYEIENTGTAASSTTLKEICSNVSMEGGERIRGLEFSKGNGATTRSITTKTPVFAIRLKDTVLAAPDDKPNRTLVKLLGVSLWAESKNTYFEVFHEHEPSSITATWTSADDSSAVEFSTDITAITSPHSHEIIPAYVASGTGGQGQTNQLSTELLTNHSFIYQNFDSTNSHVFVVFATSLPGTAADVAANLQWIEFE